MLELIKVIILACQVTSAREHVNYDIVYKRQIQCQKRLLGCTKGSSFKLFECLKERK